MRLRFYNIDSLRYPGMSTGPRANLRRPKRHLGRMRRRTGLQLQPMRRLQSGHPHVLRDSLSAPSEPGTAGPSRYHRQNRQVNGNPSQPPDGRKGRRMDETTNVRGANVKREKREREKQRERETLVYISDFSNYLLHFTM